MATVSELIATLREMPPDAEVFMRDYQEEMGYPGYALAKVSQWVLSVDFDEETAYVLLEW